MCQNGSATLAAPGARREVMAPPKRPAVTAPSYEADLDVAGPAISRGAPARKELTAPPANTRPPAANPPAAAASNRPAAASTPSQAAKPASTTTRSSAAFPAPTSPAATGPSNKSVFVTPIRFPLQEAPTSGIAAEYVDACVTQWRSRGEVVFGVNTLLGWAKWFSTLQSTEPANLTGQYLALSALGRLLNADVAHDIHELVGSANKKNRIELRSAIWEKIVASDQLKGLAGNQTGLPDLFRKPT